METKNENPSAAPRGNRLVKWVTLIVGIVVILAGGVKVISAITLPDCDSEEIVSTVKDLFKGKGAELDEVSKPRLVSEDKGGKSCAAGVRGQGETAQITYQVFWDGWTKKVKIGEVKVEPAAGAQKAPAK